MFSLTLITRLYGFEGRLLCLALFKAVEINMSISVHFNLQTTYLIK